ncbi:MAG: AgmX/PglI C-terminal domain-containing protein [Deltaproteobacteria bacterium]|nr:AgmX/PglI C-terminal domain-containing protein [Deltaproteobacteria bacterium]
MTMKRGHAITLAGALLALLGGLALDWQTFAIAGVAARSFEVPLAGQLALALASLVAVAAVVGLVSRRPRRVLGVTLTGGVFLLGWMLVADVQRDGGLTLMPGEVITVGAGYTLALWGAVLAFGGALAALASEPRWDPRTTKLRVALLRGDTVERELVVHEPRPVTLGGGAASDVVAAGLGRPRALVVPQGKSWALRLDDLAGGFVQGPGGRVEVDAARARGEELLPLDEGSFAVVELADGARLYVQHLRPEPGVSVARGGGQADESLGASLSVSFFAQALIVVVSILLWQVDPVRATFVEQKRSPDIAASVRTLTEPTPPPVVEDDRPASTEAKAAGGVEGRFGDPEEAPEKVSKAPTVDAKRVERLDEAPVGLNSLLSTRNLNGGGAIATIFKESNEGLGNKLAVAMAGSDDELVFGHGTRGLSFQGDGDGGPGDGTGRIMAQGTLDLDPGPGIHASMGPRRPPKRVPTVGIGSGTSSEMCKKGDIAARMNRMRGGFRACYEQRLQVKDGLQGKLTVQWTIGLDGAVMSASAVEDSLGDRATTDCVMRSLRRIRFAAPDGGVCVVRWPFVFSAR